MKHSEAKYLRNLLDIALQFQEEFHQGELGLERPMALVELIIDLIDMVEQHASVELEPIEWDDFYQELAERLEERVRVIHENLKS